MFLFVIQIVCQKITYFWTQATRRQHCRRVQKAWHFSGLFASTSLTGYRCGCSACDVLRVAWPSRTTTCGHKKDFGSILAQLYTVIIFCPPPNNEIIEPPKKFTWFTKYLLSLQITPIKFCLTKQLTQLALVTMPAYSQNYISILT